MPRSGISLMMQMLAAGGMPILSDGERLTSIIRGATSSGIALSNFRRIPAALLKQKVWP